MEKLFKRIMLPSMISSIVIMVIGIIIFIYPETTLNIIAKIIGFTIIAIGIVGVFQYFANRDESSLPFSILYIVTCIILGIIAVFNHEFISSIIPIILGIWICLDSLIKMRMAVGLKNLGVTRWTYPLIMGILTLVIGIFLIFNPFESAVVITRVIASLIIIYAVIDMAQGYIISSHIKDLR